MKRRADLRGACPDGPWAHLLRTPETARAAVTKPAQDRRGEWDASWADRGRAGWGGGKRAQNSAPAKPAASGLGGHSRSRGY